MRRPALRDAPDAWRVVTLQLDMHASLVSGPVEIDPARRELRLRGQPRPLAIRAFEILLMLARSRGELVTKEQLLAEIWRGAAVGDNVLQVHISAIRKALGPERRRLVTAYGRGYSLAGNWAPAPATAPHAPVPSAARTNLPLSGSRLVARERALEEVSRLVAAHRLVTLTGTGGIGKTSIAVEVARRMAHEAQQDAWLVELAPLTDDRLLPQAVAGALGQHLPGRRVTAEDVAAALGAERKLLLLDNCEHVISGAAELSQAVLRQCPNVTILATSREILLAPEEKVYAVRPLDVPPASASDPAEIRQHGAVALFLERMLGPCTGRVVEDLRPIARICQWLDGIPLAIEIAAARAALLGPHAVAERLDLRINAPAGMHAMKRHATVHATLDWSHGLLTESERRVFRRLSVFTGGFRLEAACFVAADGMLDDLQVEDAVAGLVAKSLLIFTPTPMPRWRLLETTRAFAREKLSEAGEAGETGDVSDRHATWVGRRMQRLWGAGAPQPGEVAEEVRELDNVRAAMDWLFGHGGRPADGAALVADFVPVLLHQGLAFECQERVEQALQLLQGTTPTRPGIRTRLLATLMMTLQRTSKPSEYSDRVIRELQQLTAAEADPAARLFSLGSLWNYFANADRHHAARDYAQAFASLARESGSLVHQVAARNMLGFNCHHLGNHDAAARHLAQARVLSHGAGDEPLVWLHYDQRTYTGAATAPVLWQLGRLDEAFRTARRTFDEALAAKAGIGVCIATFLGMAPIGLAAGDIASAVSALDIAEEVATARRMAFACTIIDCFRGMVRVATGDARGGAAVLQEKLDRLRELGRTTYYGYYLAYHAEALLLCGDAAGAELLLDEALSHARRCGELWIVPEILRLRAECLMAHGGAERDGLAAAQLEAAQELAGQNGSAFWALRIALSKMRLHRDEPKRGLPHLIAARDAIKGGADWTDVKRARAFARSAGSVSST